MKEWNGSPPQKMTSKNNLQVKVGIGILVFKDGKILLGKRKGSHGAGEYSGLGGHLEYGESIIECAKRECREEAGIEIKNIRLLRVSNIIKYSGKHYLDVGLIVEWRSGKPKVLEPQKLESWYWYDLNNLPKPLFEPIKHSISALKTGKNFFDS